MPQYALTNFSAEFWMRFRPTAPVLGFFRDIIVSGTERLVKPDPAIFRLAERRFRLAPADIFFIDDNAENIAAARDCGWQTHRFDAAQALEAALVETGLLP